ncbi:hypothetical protein IFR04_007812 [Cadophora malorum]|uniref:Uncharacterized protein n=1 Tax=Cadophora malorum TaxID=108018 RepID=A0A8H7W652_9HELO|nr:hypothetical protein IFR04_007812 [Cadophora malorum]
MQENDEYRSLNQRISAAVERKSKAVLFGQLKQDNCNECNRQTMDRDLCKICQNCLNKFRGKESDRDIVDEFLGSAQPGDHSIEAMMKKHGWIRKEGRH